jgi:glyoxylase-like metal-dependent hydrolase (beta-lactamase superfamily II)
MARWSHSRDPLHAPVFTDSVRPVIDAGLVEPVETDTALTRDVHLKMTPGHTPGHLSVWVGHRCVITGDVLHHVIQFRHPRGWRVGTPIPTRPER